MKPEFLKVESFRRGILLSSGFNFLSKFLVFVQSLIIAYFFGVQPSTDIYFYCVSVITLVSLFINSLDTSVIIPEAMRLRAQAGNTELIKFVNWFIYGYALLGIAATITISIHPVSFFQLVSRFDLNALEQNKMILFLTIPLFILTILVNLLANVFTSYRYFTMPMILSLVNGLFVVVFVWALHDGFGVLSALLGQLLAYMINLVFLVILMSKHLGWNFGIFSRTIERRVYLNLAYAQAGNLTAMLTAYVPLYLLTGFGTGIITALTYGQKTAELPNQLITNQVSAVSSIQFNELFARKAFDDLDSVFRRTVGLLLFLLIPISSLLFLFSNDLLTLLYKRGAFGSESIAVAASYFRYFVWLLPMYGINTMVARLFMAELRVVEAFYYQVVFNVALILLVVFGVKSFGSTGYPAALVAIHTLNLFGFYWLLKRFFPHINYLKIAINGAMIVLLNIFLFVVVFYGSSVILDGMIEIVRVFVGSGVYLLGVVILNSIFKVNKEIDLVAVKMINELRAKLQL